MIKRTFPDYSGALGCMGPRGLRPYTDHEAAHRLGTEPLSDYDVTACWHIDIGSLLPVPSGDIQINDLVRFREEYDDERQRLMFAIDEMLHRLKQADRHPQDAFSLVEKELSEALTDVRAAAQGRKLNLVARPLAVTVAIGAASIGAITEPALAVPMGVLSSLVVNMATGRIRRAGNDSRNLADFTYLHRVEKAIEGAV